MGKKTWIGLYVVNWVIIFFYWLSSASPLLSGGVGGRLLALGQIAGLAAGCMVLTQFFLMGRAPFLEKIWGLDRLSRFHAKHGKTAFLILLAHPILILGGYSVLSGTNYFAEISVFLGNTDDTVNALVGLLLLFGVIGTSIVIVRKKLKYEAWYFAHLLAYLSIFFVYEHQFELGTTLNSSKIFYGYWVLLYVFVGGSHLFFRFIRPWYLFWRHRFVVTSLVRETPTTVSVHIGGKDLESFMVEPGQFLIVRFLSKKLWWQMHPFSISLFPNGSSLRLTVKELGDYTKEIQHIVPGTKVVIDGPYGIFTEKALRKEKVLMIAGGIGITPIRALFESLLKKGKDVVLLYANKSEQDIALRSEIDGLAKENQARVVHIMSDQPEFSGERGRVDLEKISKLVPDVKLRDVYLCGPIPMMHSVRPVLATLGVPQDQIHYEEFSF